MKNLIRAYKNIPFQKRASFINKITMVANLFFAGVKFFIAYLLSSIAISLSGFYTIFIGIAKTAYFDGLRNATSLREERKYYKRIAFALSLAGFVYLFYFIAIFIQPKDTKYDLILSIAIATIAFVEIFLAISGLYKSKKSNDLLLTGLKFINLASGLSSLVLAQIALLAVASNSANAIFNTITGTIVGVATMVIALYMVISDKLKFKKYYPILKLKRRFLIHLKGEKHEN